MSGNNFFQRSPHMATNDMKYCTFHIPYKNELMRNQMNQSPTGNYNEPHRFRSIQSVELQVSEILARQSISQRCVELTSVIKDCLNVNSAKNVLSQFKPIVENIFGISNAQLNSSTSSMTASSIHKSSLSSTADWMLKNIHRSKNLNDYEAVIAFLHPDGVLFALIRSLMLETTAKFEFPFNYFPPQMRVMIENGLTPAIFSNKIASINYMSASPIVFNPFEFYIFNFVFYIINNQNFSSDDPNTSTDLSDIAYFALLQIYLNLGSVEWRCHTFLLMTEVWLGSTGSSCRVPVTVYPFNANPDQMRAIRILVKNQHNFSSSKYPLQSKLYSYLRESFTRWPMDSSFRLPLETWLSYIQPWRYATNKPPAADNTTIDPIWKNYISDNLLYYNVIFGQILQRILQLDLASSRNSLMLSRVIKVYSQPGFMNLLKEAEETVCRINIEQKMSATSPVIKSPTRNLVNANGGFKTRFSPFRHHLMECETNPEFSYTSLFSPQMKQQVARLLVEVYKARQTIKEFVSSVDLRSSQRDRGWVQSFVAFLTSNDTYFESMDEREMYNDKLKADNHLSFAIMKLTSIFEIDPLTDDQINAQNQSTMRLDEGEASASILRHRNFSTPKPDVNRLDLANDHGSPRLTPLGRFQIMNKLAKSDNFSEGNPDLQPVRSFEISYMVTFTIFLSNWLNAYYMETITRAYSSHSFTGWLTRALLSPPVSYIEIQKKHASIAPQRLVKNLPPRINLRFLAHKYVMVLILLVWLLLYLFLM